MQRNTEHDLQTKYNELKADLTGLQHFVYQKCVFRKDFDTRITNLDERVRVSKSQMKPFEIAVNNQEERLNELEKRVLSVKTMQIEHGDIMTRLAALERNSKQNQNHNTHYNHYNHRSRSDTDPIQKIVDPVHNHVIKPFHNWLGTFKERAGQNPYMINASVHQERAPVNPLAASNA